MRNNPVSSPVVQDAQSELLLQGKGESRPKTWKLNDRGESEWEKRRERERGGDINREGERQCRERKGGREREKESEREGGRERREGVREGVGERDIRTERDRGSE